ncbi:MAG: DUF4041 domain-containing protein [Polyangiaceae bacterium]|nr:DUF4041 domain-containing protein [Polyangiaceae bacterium]
MNAPPGWYPDAGNPACLRWWDGRAWSSHVRASPAGNLSPVAPVAPSLVSAASPTPQAPQALRHSPEPLVGEVEALRREYELLRAQIVETTDAMILQEVGIYEYSHPLDSAAAYKDLLADLQGRMKACIKSGQAVATTKRWVINGSEKEGAKMVGDFGKLILRAYDNEADNVLRTMKPYTLESAVERLEKMRTLIAKLGASMKLAITDTFHALRVEELRLTADYLAKVAEEKDREREERARLKEEEMARREFEREQARLEKERTHYETALRALREKGDATAVAEVEQTLTKIEQAIAGVVQRAANVRAGYVYVISNLGSFGEAVVKIGMTRRLEPLDRVRELGDASVPFRFDVHALIFSDDAVGLERALHERFSERRLNLVNTQREFFYATPHEVKTALLELKGDLLSFVEAPEALEWHQSETARREALAPA